jgi:hypothetical protein
MTLLDRRRACLGAILFLLASQGAAQKSEDLTAVLTQIEGQVTLGNVRRAAQRQVIRRGEMVHVPPGAQVTLICSTERLESLTGPQDWVLEAAACERGRVLPESSYRNVAGYAGRMIPRKGNLLLELEPRGVEAAFVPILLSPRNTAVMKADPRLVWTQVPGAVEYEITVRGPVETSIRLAADDLPCGRGSGPWHGLDVCSWIPSGRWPRLEPEKPVFLRLGSRQVLGAPLREIREVVYKVHLLSVDDQHGMEERLHQIAMFPLDKASRLLLTAGAYAQSGLYADAIDAYDVALQAQEMPEARVALGDLYLKIGLVESAEREYRQVPADAPDPAVHAAAELGLGYVTYARNLFDEARAHFERAGALYATLCLPAEEEEARAAAALVQAPSGNGSP